MTPAAATQLSLTTLYPTSTVAGASHTVVVTALDAYGNTATGYAGLVTVTASGGTTHVSPSVATALTGGVGSYGVTFDTVGTGRQITASGTLGVTQDSQAGITVTPAAATHLTVTGYPSPATAGVAHNVTVTALDAYGNLVTGYAGTVHITSTGAAVLPSDGTLTGGTGSFSVTLKTAGSQSITATDTVTSITGSQTGIVIIAADADHFSLTGYPSPTTAGVAHSVTVTARDAYGNLATGYLGTVQVTSSDGAAVLPGDYAFVSGDGGVHQFSVTLKTAGSQSITATDTGSITGSQAGITVTPAAATQLSLTTLYPTSTVAGASHTVVVTALDAYGNTATGYAGLVTVTASGGTTHVSPSVATALTGGVGSYGVTFDTVGTGRQITASGTLGVTQDSQAGITVTPAAATQLSLTTLYPTSTVAGASHTVVVTALDAYGNTATGYAGLVTVTASGGTTHVSPSVATALTGGVGSYGVTFDTVGTGRQITASGTLGVTQDSQAGITVTPAAATQLSLTTLYPTSTVAGAPHTVVVTALDAYGNTATGYAGLVTVTASGGTTHVSPSVATALTGGVGSYGVTFDTVGTGRQITASGTLGVTQDSQAGITVTPAAATQLSLTTLYPTSTVAGASHTVVVTALDAYGNTATGYAGLVTVTASGGTTHVSPSVATALTGGVGSYGVTFDTVGTGRQITASGTLGVTQDSQAGITVTPAAATQLSLTTLYPTSTVAGASHTVVVTALDAYGNTATGYAGLVTVTASGGTTHVSPSVATALTGGVGSYGVTFDTVGTGRQITASGTLGVTQDSQAGITVTPAAATQLSLTTLYPTSTVAGASHTVVVTALDAYGNTATGYAGLVTVTASGGTTHVSPSVATALTGGVGSYGVTFDTVGTGRQITASGTLGVTQDSQAGITVTPAAATQLSLTTLYPTSTVAGASHTVVVTALDAYGNTATGYAGLVTVTASGGTTHVSPSVATALTGGVGSYGVTFDTVGTGRQITASGTLGVTQDSQAGITVTPAAATHLTVTGYPSPATAGVAHNVTVTALDAYGNLVTGYAGTVHITSTGAAVLPSDGTLTGGTGSFSVTLKTAGSQSITATDTVTSITGSQTGIVIIAADADHFSLTGYPSPTTAGVAHSVTVTARDAYGNLATGYPGTVQVTSSDGAAVLPGDYAFVSGDGGAHQFSVTLKTAGSQSITATDTAARSPAARPGSP